MPTDNDLSQKYGVSRLTIRKAKANLIEEGLIYSVQGSGSYVNEPRLWKVELNGNEIENANETLDDFIRTDMNTTFRILEFAMVPNSEPIIKKLKNSRDRFIFQIHAVRFTGSTPFSYEIFNLPFDIGSKIPISDLEASPMIPQFEKFAGIRVTEGIFTIMPGRASRKESKHLKVKVGSPVLLMEKIYFNLDAKPVEFRKATFRQDYKYRIRIRRSLT